MKGNNQLILNEATMIEAVQLWLASKYPEKTPVVTAVTLSNSRGAYDKDFKIELAEHGTALA